MEYAEIRQQLKNVLFVIENYVNDVHAQKMANNALATIEHEIDRKFSVVEKSILKSDDIITTQRTKEPITVVDIDENKSMNMRAPATLQEAFDTVYEFFISCKQSVYPIDLIKELQEVKVQSLLQQLQHKEDVIQLLIESLMKYKQSKAVG